MNKKSIESKFSIDIDAYFNGIKHIDEPQDGEYNEILKLGKALADKDFSRNSNKKAVFNKTLKNINQSKEEEVMKNSNKIRKISVAAASFVIVCGVFSQTSFAKDLAEKVINKISLGHITAVQSEGPSSMDVPANLKGKIFDKNGKALTVVTKDTGKVYTESGEEIAKVSNGKILTATEVKAKDEKEKENILVIKDVGNLNKYTCFDVKLPSYLPKDYKFDRAEFYKGKDGSVSKKYIDLFFTNEKTGKYIYMQQRFADEETKYEDGTDGKIEKIKVNGIDAILYDNRSIDWETNKVLYGLSGRGEFGRDELIKIAESIK
ncbi:DUF4367 domain-containing protein [Clostridium sp. PL3]|uniref:DUF4367 domain-containing protein n=1 Tax=Clostridium thailandense TaxID=2794346 RepID=A0A949WR14_9CLOT|nr:DUF4367 domain-containing protein [Clostridium thailandense]MBV7273455.1 DUF4367 domain-containing protein [Clostridium thailandense]